MSDKHTPGPWAIHHDGKPLFGYWHIRQDPKDWDGHGYQAVCTLPADKNGTHYGEMFHANAKLITAAPTLLKALRGLLARATAPATADEDWEVEIQEAERAIATATK